MVFVKDAVDLRFVLINRAGEELLGIDRSEFIGKSDYDFFPKAQADFLSPRTVTSCGPEACMSPPKSQSTRAIAGCDTCKPER